MKFFLKGPETRFSRKLLDSLEKEYRAFGPVISDLICKFFEKYFHSRIDKTWVDERIKRIASNKGIHLSGDSLMAEAFLRGVYCPEATDDSWIHIGDKRFYAFINGSLATISEVEGSIGVPYIMEPRQIIDIRPELQLDYERRVLEVLSESR